MLTGRFDVDGIAAPTSISEQTHLESLIRDEFERCRPGDTLDDVKRRASFSKEDSRLYRDWMAIAAQRATARKSQAAD